MAGYVSGNGSQAQAPPGYVWDPVNKYYKAANSPTAAAATNPTTHTSTSTGPNGQVVNQQVPYTAQELKDQAARANAVTNQSIQGSQNSSATTTAKQAAQTASGINSSFEVDSNGNASYASLLPGQSMADQTSLMQAQAKVQADAEERRYREFAGLFQAPAQVSSQMSGDESAARQAAFNRSKDQVGLTTRSALNSLRDAYAGTGNIGGENQAITQLMSGGANQLGEVSREQLIQDLNRSSAIGDRNYQGAITQRGQDMSLAPSIFGLLTARGLY